MDQPHGVVEASNKELFVSDRNNDRIVNYDIHGRFIEEIGKEDLALPTGIAADELHHFAVCDTDNDRVLRYDTGGHLDAELGSFGRGRRQFNKPTDLAFDPAGNLYVVDKGNERIQVFDRNLRPAFEITLDGVLPAGIFIDQEFFTYIVDSRASRVLILNNRFQVIDQLPPPSASYELSQPVDLTMTKEGRLHIVDRSRNSIALLRVEQEMLLRRGKIRVATRR